MTRQYDGVRPVVEGTLEGDTWTTSAVNYWEGPTYYSPLVLRLLPSGGYNYLADGLGSTRQLMRNSDHFITDTYDYDAFGNTTALTGGTDNPYRYVGVMGYRKDQNGLYQLGIRALYPTIGRFAQRDRISPMAEWAYASGNPDAVHGSDWVLGCHPGRVLYTGLDYAVWTKPRLWMVPRGELWHRLGRWLRVHAHSDQYGVDPDAS